MKATPVNNDPTYSGPKNHSQIILQIRKDARKANKNVKLPFIKKTVALFFSVNGFPKYFLEATGFSVTGLGRWILSPKGVRRFAEAEEKKIAKANAAKEKKYQNEKRKQDIFRKKNAVLNEHANLVKSFNRVNKRIGERGQPPWKWDEWCKHKNKKMFISWGSIPWSHWNW